MLDDDISHRSLSLLMDHHMVENVFIDKKTTTETASFIPLQNLGKVTERMVNFVWVEIEPCPV